MALPAAFVGVILIWSTTPLAIKWSGEGPGFLFGVTGRMFIGAVLALSVARLLGVVVPWHRRARATYLAAGLGIYGAMLSVYWAASVIPSGWISVIFGLSPMVTGVFAALWLQENSLTPAKLFGMLLGLAGLGVIFGEGAAWEPRAASGIAGVLLSVLIHSLSSVWVKRIGTQMSGMATTTGALLVAVPLFLATWFLSGQSRPVELSVKAGLSITYLGVFGSVLGFALYYYVLRHSTATRVSLLTLVTPVLALLLGNWINDEPVRGGIWLGMALILSGLFAFELQSWIGVLCRRPRAGGRKRSGFFRHLPARK